MRIRELIPCADLVLKVVFDDGKSVLYDVSEDVDSIPASPPLASEPGLFRAVRLDESRTCVYWNDAIDLPSDAIYEYGEPLEAQPRGAVHGAQGRPRVSPSVVTERRSWVL